MVRIKGKLPVCIRLNLNSFCQLLIIGVAPIGQVMHVRNENSNFQWRSLNVISDFPYYKELLIKERICFLWEQILSFKRSSHFEKGRNCREPLLDTVVSL